MDVTNGLPVHGPPVNGAVSFWWSQAGRPTRRPALDGDVDCDVCIVGGGLTGLWTAYWLAQHDPSLDIVVLEAEFAGFGASGRNGGWLTAELSGSKERYARSHGKAGVEALVASMERAVDEVIGICRDEGVDADIVKSGLLHVARSPAQLVRMREALADDARWGIGESHQHDLDADETAERVQVEGALGAVFSPHGARVQPARLVAGIAAAVERRGVRILEETRVSRIDPGRAVTAHGEVRAKVVLRCLEGYTASIRGQRRAWLPMNSAIVVTEPLDPQTWTSIGWDGHELLGDFANAYCYAQHTADGRIALGGRGAPYHFGSSIRPDHDRDHRVHTRLEATLGQLLPPAAGARITHQWGGPLGIPRDWTASVGLDRATGLAWAGGYVGDGVAAANLAGRTLADLIRGHDSELTILPWVQHRSRPWEPEPLRWLGVNTARWLAASTDASEQRTNRPARLRGRLLDLFLGD